ncbi:MAG: hypothetical protein J6B12_06225, partial [Clostridia bacterium]|nr:hypothetical protein [Clostridia bacterium]
EPVYKRHILRHSSSKSLGIFSYSIGVFPRLAQNLLFYKFFELSRRYFYFIFVFALPSKV